MQIVVGDIGGTHARFALAEVDDGRVLSLGEPVVLRAREFAGIQEAWAAFAAQCENPLPAYASLAVAGPVIGGPVHFVNSSWVIDPATLAADLHLQKFLLLNDFGAMAHAVNALDASFLTHLVGPDIPLPAQGAISVIGAGTGLGVAVLSKQAGRTTVLETEGAHIHFAPLDAREVTLNAALTARYGRTSVERVVSGAGLGAIVRTELADDTRDDATLWAAAVDGSDPAVSEALQTYLACYGAAVGDLSLAHGSLGVALTGGLTNRIRHLIPGSRFHQRFCEKGRYHDRMVGIPIKLITHPQPGLFGAAAAFAKDHP